MKVTMYDSQNQVYEYTMDDAEVQLVLTADKAGINYELNNLYGRTNPNFLFNIFMQLKDKELIRMEIMRNNSNDPLVYEFLPGHAYMTYNFSTLERNNNLPNTLRDNEVLRLFCSYDKVIDETVSNTSDEGAVIN